MADFDASTNWTEVLPQNPLFEQLGEEGSELITNGNLMCEIRGDLFVWSAAKSALLTTNLKRIKAFPSEPQAFQTLVCTNSPLNPITHLIPDAPGQHIALCSKQSLSVLKLMRSRGKHGEFGGGQAMVNCRVTPVATDLFAIYRHSLRLLQTEWHPTRPATLCLLTSDSTLRLFSLANPNIPLFSIPLTPSAANLVHGCTLEDTVVSFGCARDRVFSLRDTGDVSVVELAPNAVPSSPLPMHPLSEDNYGNEATALLVLQTTPLTLIIANSNGVLYHCVFLEGKKEEQEEEEGEEEEECPPQSTAGYLYVVESVQLELRNEDTPLSLTKDPVLPYRYFILHADGINTVTLPWLDRMEKFTTSDLDTLIMDADSQVEYLLATEDPEVSRLQGAVFISEPLLGPSLVALTSDWECLALSLPSPLCGHFVTADETTPTKPHPQVQTDMSGFEKVIRDILEVGQHPPIISKSQSKELSQEECFDFLRCSIQTLRTKYFLLQRRAKAEIQHRVDILCRQKEQQLRDLVALRDEGEEVRERSEDVKRRVEEVRQRGMELMQRLERFLCQLDAQSPVLSDAEVGMGQELDRVSSKLQQIHPHLEEAKGKLRVGYGHTKGSTGVNLSESQYRTVCSALAETGKKLVALKQQIQGLVAMTPS